MTAVFIRLLREIKAVWVVVRTRSIMLALARVKSTLRYRQLPLKTYAPAGLASAPGGLVAILDERGIKYSVGTHTIYLHPGEELTATLPELVDDFPPGTGFKVLKRERGKEVERYNLTKYLTVQNVMSGTLADTLAVAMRLYDLGMGPAIMGLVSLKVGKIEHPCFAVGHVDGRQPSISEHAKFIEILRAHLASHRLRFLPWHGFHHDDFGAPDCNGNLIIDRDGNPKYVDFQGLAL